MHKESRPLLVEGFSFCNPEKFVKDTHIHALVYYNLDMLIEVKNRDD
jgi:hypothetical protein